MARSLTPSKKYSVSHPVEAGRRQPWMLLPDWASPGGAEGVGAVVTAGALCH